MANEFLNNLRASRSGSQRNTTNSLPTRGDMQKQKQNNATPASFIDFFRAALGFQNSSNGKKRLSIEDIPSNNVDRMSPEDMARASEQSDINWENAERVTLSPEKDLNKYSASVKGTIDVPSMRPDFGNAYGIAANYDALNKILDEYDTVNTWSEKKRFLKDAYDKFEDKSEDITKWFDRLYLYTMQAQSFDEWDTKAVSDAMRRINDDVKKRLQKKV